MVYVDKSKTGYQGMVMCHMIADTHDELVSMADRIGVKRKWIQDAGTYREHFDVCANMKQTAIKNGAKEIGLISLGRILARKILEESK